MDVEKKAENLAGSYDVENPRFSRFMNAMRFELLDRGRVTSAGRLVRSTPPASGATRGRLLSKKKKKKKGKKHQILTIFVANFAET